MEAPVDERLGDVHRGDAAFRLSRRRENALVHAESIARSVVVAAEAGEHVVRVEDGVLGGLDEAGAAERQDICIGLEQDAEVAVEGGDIADAMFFVIAEEIGAVLPPLDKRGGEKVDELAADADGAGAGAAAAVRCGEGLVEVEVDDVEADVAGAALAEDGVQVRPVIVHEAAGLVGQGGDVFDAGVEEAEGVGASEHYGGDLVIERGAELVEVHEAVLVRRDRDDGESADGGACGVGAVCGIGDNDFGLRRSCGAMIGGDQHDARKLAVCAGERLHRERRHARDFAEEAFEVVDDLERALRENPADAELGEQRMQFAEALRVVFHRAGAEWVEAAVNAEVPARKFGEMADDVELREFGQCGVAVAEKFGWQVVHQRELCFGQTCTRSTGRGFFEDEFHSAASSASARRPISCLVRFSVTATSRQLRSDG